MSSHKAIKSGLSWQSASVIIQALIQVGLLALLARLLEPQAFGLVAMANVAIAFGQLLSEAGAAAAVVQREKPLDSPFVSAAFLTSIGIGLSLFVIQILLASTLEHFLGMEGLRPVLIALGVVFVINGFSRVSEAILQRDLRFATLMKVNFSAQMLGYVLPSILLALAGYGVWALVWATLLQALFKSVLLFLIVRGGYGLIASRSAFWEVAGFGLGMTKIKFWNYVMQQGDRFIIGRRLDADALGQYQVITQLARMPGQYAGNIIDAVFFPVMARLQTDQKRLTMVYLTLASHSFVLMIGLGLFMAANGELLVRLILGERWLPAVTLFQVFCLGAGVRIVTRIGDCVNRALGQVYAASMRKMTMAIVYLLLVWLAVPHGLLMICVAVVVAQLLGALIISHLAWQGIGLKWDESVAFLARSMIWSLGLLGLNGGLLLLKSWVGWSAVLVLVLSTTVHAALAAVYLGPLISLWRNGMLKSEARSLPA